MCCSVFREGATCVGSGFGSCLGVVFSNHGRFSNIGRDRCGVCGMGENLQGTSKAKILTKLATINRIRNCIVSRNGGAPVRNSLHCHKVHVASVISTYLGRSHFNFRRITFLLAFNFLPSGGGLSAFGEILTSREGLPPGFARSVVLGTPDGGVVGGLREDILTLCSCSRGPSSVSVPGLLHRDLRVVTHFPAVITCTCTAGLRCFGKADLILRGAGPRVSATRGFLCVAHTGRGFASVRTGVLSLYVVLRTRRNNNGGSTFTVHILSSSGASACSTVTTNINSLGNPGRNNTGTGVVSRVGRVRTGMGS